MNHPERQQLADIYASTHTIAVIGASADPDTAVLARRIDLICAPSPSAPSTLQAYRLGRRALDTNNELSSQ